MSHLQERKETNCLNCNAEVDGRYCSICGQENLKAQESTGHLFTHFFNDITHFDGKFFSSLKYLVFKPGFLTSEYVAGRRSSYLNPVRMYVFTSFVFFLIFFALQPDELIKKAPYNEQTRDSVFKAFENIKALDTVELKTAKADYDRYIGKTLRDSLRKVKADSLEALDTSTENHNREINLGFTEKDYKSLKEYDSLVRIDSVKDGFFKRLMIRKELQLDEKYGHDSYKIGEIVLHNFIHSIPQIIFLSLPLLALVLRLLYIRRKQFYYVSHLIFSLHLYIFTYIAILVMMGLSGLENVPYVGWLVGFKYAVLLCMFYYWYKALRNFYGQSRFKTFCKFLLMLFALSIIALICMLVIGFIAYFKS